MVDSVQISSSIPVPIQQTVAGSHDPLPPGSTMSFEKSSAAKFKDDALVKKERVDNQSDQNSMSTLKKSKPSFDLDVVDFIAQNSVYSQPGVSTPL